jgi:hypothetical protein
MKSQILKRYETLTRVREFGAQQAAAFPDTTLGHTLFTEVTQVVAELDKLAADRSSGLHASMGGTRSKSVLRDELREELAAINRTARAMAYTRPGLEDKFRLPRGKADQTLLTAARAFLADATPLAAEFINHEMPADFLDDLKALIAEFEAALHQRSTAKGAQVSATAGIEDALERGMVAMRRLDAIVRNKFRGQVSVLAAWTRASHVERTSRTANSTNQKPPEAPNPPQTPAPPTP